MLKNPIDNFVAIQPFLSQFFRSICCGQKVRHFSRLESRQITTLFLCLATYTSSTYGHRDDIIIISLHIRVYLNLNFYSRLFEFFRASIGCSLLGVWDFLDFLTIFAIDTYAAYRLSPIIDDYQTVPKFDLQPKIEIREFGKDHQFLCNATGIPRPRIGKKRSIEDSIGSNITTIFYYFL